MSSDMIGAIIQGGGLAIFLAFIWWGQRVKDKLFVRMSIGENRQDIVFKVLDMFREDLSQNQSDIKILFNEAREMRGRIEHLEQEPRFLKDSVPKKRGSAQQEIIAYLQAKNSCCASDIVREFGYTKPTVLKVADKLVKSGMIEKSYVKGRLVLTLKKEEGSHE